MDLLILRSLEAAGDLHGYGIARHIEVSSGQAWRIEEGSLYPALKRLEARGDVEASWRVSETGRRGRFYSLTTQGKGRLGTEKAWWADLVKTMGTFLGTAGKPVRAGATA